VFLLHILDEIQYLQKKAETLTYEQLLQDTDTEHAITRSLEIIGEASKNVSSETCRKYPAIPWKDIAGMRNRIIHGYFSINYEIVYDVVLNKIPELYLIIQEILSDPEME
jgi:uncharacterized protein with HEPN domain